MSQPVKRLIAETELPGLDDMSAIQLVRHFHKDLAKGSFNKNDRCAVLELAPDIYLKLVAGLGELLEDHDVLEGLRK